MTPCPSIWTYFFVLLLLSAYMNIYRFNIFRLIILILIFLDVVPPDTVAAIMNFYSSFLIFSFLFRI